MSVPDLRVGERWYVKLAQGATVCEREIIDLSKETVLLSDCKKRYDNYPARYCKTDITWVERTRETKSTT